jgi:hypothetical protein
MTIPVEWKLQMLQDKQGEDVDLDYQCDGVYHAKLTMDDQKKKIVVDSESTPSDQSREESLDRRTKMRETVMLEKQPSIQIQVE